MKILSLALLLLFLPCSAGAQSAAVPADGVDWKSFDEAVVLAKQADKKLVIDVYAPWCPWCRRLQREVYADSLVQQYLRDHFIATRLDGDDNEQMHEFRGYSLTSMELAQGLGTEGFPTTVFLQENSDYITRLPGFVDAAEFLRVLQYIHSEAYREKSYQEFLSQ